MSTAIVTDSTCDLPAELIAQHHIEVVCQHILWGGQSYKDGIDIGGASFYERLAREPELPKTSQPSPNEFADAYRRARENNNADSVVCITISKHLSGTYNSAEAGRALVDFPVVVIDSRNVTMALGLIVLAAAEASQRGASADEIVQVANQAADKAHVFFAVNVLEFLHRGGRIGNAQRLIGTALSIKPILTVRDGKVHSAETVRTRKRALARMVDLARCVESGTVQASVIVGGADDADALANDVQLALSPVRLLRATLCTTLGVHTGPGVVGVAVLGV